jgi:hypothetical protein
MSAFHHYELHCDVESCDASYNVAEITAGVTRKRSAEAGWIFVVAPLTEGGAYKYLDFCPDHHTEADGAKARDKENVTGPVARRVIAK